MVAPTRAFGPLAAAIILAASVGGCATPRSTPGSAPAATSPTGHPSPGRPDPSGATATVTEADNASTIRLALGQHLQVYLAGTLSAPWSPISLAGSALSAAANGKGALPVGVTGGFYVAIRPGHARLTSSRPTCTAPGSTGTGCEQAQFTVDVEVH
jgi:hypothetical protein